MARENLPQGQITPVAKPIGAFLQPTRADIGKPIQPGNVPDAPRFAVIDRGNGGNVQGFNQWEELASALAPFSERLISTAAAGAQLYADTEFEKGQNEVLRAQVLANRQAQQSAARYAADGRRIAQQDPYAAVLMDRVNPFRQWGRENQLTRIAGQEVGPALVERYRNEPGVQGLKPGDPRLKEIQAETVAQITQKYGISDGSRGFVENFLPMAGKAEQQLYEQHLEDYTKDAKERAWRRSTAEAIGVFRAARLTKTIEWEELDPTTQQFVQRRASLVDNPREWQRGLAKVITQISDRLADETGIPGEASWLQRQMFQQIAEAAGDFRASDLLEVLKDVEYGPKGPGVVRPTLRDTMGPDLTRSENELAQIQYQRDELANKRGLQAFEDDVVPLLSMPDGPEKKQRISELTAKYANQGVRLSDMTDSIKSLSASVETVDLMGFDTRPVDDFLSRIQQQYGSSFDRKRNYQILLSLIKTFPADLREEYMGKFNAIAERESSRKISFPSGLIDPLINNKVKANTLKIYPQDAKQAAIRGGDILQQMAYGNANIAESVSRQTGAYRDYVYRRLEAAQIKKGAELSVREITSIVNDAVAEYGQKDKDSYEYMFPGSQYGTPGVDGTRQATPSGSPAPAKPAPARPPVYPSGQLDNVPDRSRRLVDPRVPVLALPSVKEEVQRVVGGGRPSGAVQRAARDAKMSVGNFLLKQAEKYPEYKLPPAQRQRLLQSSAGAEGLARNIVAAAVDTGSRLSRYAFRAIAPPANAAAAGPGVSTPSALLSLIRSGEGGWDSVNRGTAGDTPPMRGLSQMTIGQVMALQRKGVVFAAGAYQIVPKTMEIALRDSGLSPAAPFNPENQSRLAMALIVGSKRPALRDYITGRSDNLDAAHSAIASEWASLQGPTGRGAYDGDSAGNKASVPASRVRQALIEARRLMGGR